MKKHCSVGPLECIFIARPKIGSLCGLGVRAHYGGTLTWKAVVPFTMEINFLSKVYLKSLLEGSPLSCALFEEAISSPQYGYRYLSKRLVSFIYSIL